MLCYLFRAEAQGRGVPAPIPLQAICRKIYLFRAEAQGHGVPLCAICRKIYLFRAETQRHRVPSAGNYVLSKIIL